MISTFWNIHQPQECHFNVIRDTGMQHKRNWVRSGIDAKNRVFVVRITFRGNVSLKNRVLVTASWMLCWRFSFLVVASNFVKWIQSSCHWIKFHTLPFVLSSRVSFGGYVQWICMEAFTMDQAFVSAPWNFPFCLSLWSSFFQCLLFRQNSWLAKKLSFKELSVYY